MSPVHKLTAMGSLTSNKVDFPSMTAGYGDFGAMQRIGFYPITVSTTFNNIPQIYQDLRVVIYSRDTNASVNTTLFNYMNADSSALYSFTYLNGDGASAASGRASGQGVLGTAVQTGASATSGIFAINTMDILNYTSSTTFKTILYRSAADANGSGNTRLSVGLYRSTNPITAISAHAASAFASGTTVAIYGIKSSAA